MSTIVFFYLQKWDVVDYLLCVWWQADNDVELFMTEKHNFDQYSREVRKYKRLADDIQYHCQKVSEAAVV